MKDSIKVDFLIGSMEAGGAQRVISNIANYLAEKGYKIRIISLWGPDHYELNQSITRVRLHKRRIFNTILLNGFLNLLFFYRKKQNRPNIVSSHIDLYGLITIPVCKIFNIKIIVSEHNNHLAYNNRAQSICWNYFYPYADLVTILTEFDKEFFLKKNKNTIVLPNPCSFETILTTKTKNTELKQIVAIGNLDRYKHKGFDNLIEIVKPVLEGSEGWILKIVGDGTFGMDYLKQKVKRLQLSEKVIFTGYQKNIQGILSNSDIFILSSRFEGLPMVLLEAMSQGVPCISYDCISGPSDIITHNKDGILVENQNIEAMQDELYKLTSNTQLRRKLAKNAPKALEKFSISKVGKQWEEILHTFNNQ
ncbi:glycosyltransferase family 4 protein [Maribacter sp. MJ134]|uniref:glycosyltransferase family 4 protein n=1 Tax=Maribacter sp. MJ134 TaxID=2496865 RepID=UPI000F82D7DB|nr:glycosyltransferase family 4 protein [Maribacter sp. MJ134]AZQ58470.1 glycosyltransferase family 4 protein [Maribacter sp. MJ134]